MNSQFRIATPIVLALCIALLLAATSVHAQDQLVKSPNQPASVARGPASAPASAPAAVLAHPDVYNFSSDLDTLRANANATRANKAATLANPAVYEYSSDLERLHTMAADRQGAILAHPEVYEYTTTLDILRTRFHPGW